MLESIANSIAKAGQENKEVLGDIGSKIENGQTKISTSLDSAAEILDGVKDELKSNGEMMEVGLETVGTKLGLIETVATNLKNFETSAKEGLSLIVADIEDLTKEIVTNLLKVKDEIGVVGSNIEDSKDSINDVGETLTALNSLVEYVKAFSETLVDLDDNTKINLEMKQLLYRNI